MNEAAKLTLYVYYKIPAQQQAHYLLAIKELTQAVKVSYPFLRINHQKRPDLDAENRELWMETYHGILSGECEKFKADLAALAEQKGLPPERKCEIFISL